MVLQQYRQDKLLPLLYLANKVIVLLILKQHAHNWERDNKTQPTRTGNHADSSGLADCDEWRENGHITAACGADGAWPIRGLANLSSTVCPAGQTHMFTHTHACMSTHSLLASPWISHLLLFRDLHSPPSLPDCQKQQTGLPQLGSPPPHRNLFGIAALWFLCDPEVRFRLQVHFPAR